MFILTMKNNLPPTIKEEEWIFFGWRFTNWGTVWVLIILQIRTPSCIRFTVAVVRDFNFIAMTLWEFSSSIVSQRK